MFGSISSIGLRTRFVLIGVAVLIPLVAVMFQLAQYERERALASAEERVRLFASLTADRQYRLVQQAQIVLSQLANDRQVRGGGEDCSAVLANAAARHEWMGSIRFSTPEGSGVCADSPDVRAIDNSDRPYFKAVLAGEVFAISDQLTSRSTGSQPNALPVRRPIIVAAVPVLERDGLAGVLAATIELEALSDLLPEELSSDTGVIVNVIDSQGSLLARHPPDPDFVGRPDADEPVVQRALQFASGTAELPDLKGNVRLFAFQKIDAVDWVVAVGIGRSAVLGPIDAALHKRLALIAFIVMSSCVIGLIGGEVFVFWPLRALTSTAQALERGDMAARPRLTGLGEVGVLEQSLNSMAKAIQQREADLKASRAAWEQAVSDTQQANAAKSQFLASMSHEIRTPLSGIVGFNDLLLAQDLQPQQRRYAERIEAAAAAMISVIDGILDISRIEARELEIEQRPFSIAGLVDSAIALIQPRAERKGLDLTFEVDPAVPPAVLGDEARLRQVLLNLLTNAVKFTTRGTVTLRVHNARSDGHVRFSILDSGIGIAEDQHHRLFRRFSQAHDADRNHGGSGLGLAISKELAELMGGQLGFSSEQNVGSTFWVELALPEADASSVEPHAAAVHSPRAGRILVADDYEMTREVTCAMLTLAGHVVDVVTDGAEAVAAVRRNAYDLVLLDIEMQGMNGIVAAKQIRRLQGRARHVPVIAMTANVLPQQIRAFREAGMDGHLGKPFTRNQLIHKVNQFLSPAQGAIGGVARISAAQAATFDEKALAEMKSLIGEQRTAAWMSALRTQLEALVSLDTAGISRHRLARTAHTLVSQAGSLGFAKVSTLSSELEEACVENADYGDVLARARKACRAALGKIDRMQKSKRPPARRRGAIQLAGAEQK